MAVGPINPLFTHQLFKVDVAENKYLHLERDASGTISLTAIDRSELTALPDKEQNLKDIVQYVNSDDFLSELQSEHSPIEKQIVRQNLIRLQARLEESHTGLSVKGRTHRAAFSFFKEANPLICHAVFQAEKPLDPNQLQHVICQALPNSQYSLKYVNQSMWDDLEIDEEANNALIKEYFLSSSFKDEVLASSSTQEIRMLLDNLKRFFSGTTIDSETHAIIDFCEEFLASFPAPTAHLSSAEQLRHRYETLLKAKTELKGESQLGKTIVALEATDAKRLHGHILGDLFLKGTELEGAQPGLTRGYLRRVVQDKLLNREELIDEKAKLEQFVAQLDVVDAIENADPDQQRVITEKITALSANETVLISGGWIGNPLGHQVYYEIEKQEDGQLTFRIYNTGGGVQYHDSVEDQWLNKIHSYTEVKGIAPGDFLNDEVLGSLLKLKEIVIKRDGTPTKFSAKDLYEGILPLMGGRRSPPNLALESLMLPQNSGTCTWMSLLAILHKKLSPAAFKRMEFEVKMQGLIDTWEALKPELARDPELMILLKESISYFSESISEYDLSDQELINAQASFHEILDEVERVKIQLSHKHRQSDEAYTWDRNNSTHLLASFPTALIPTHIPQAAVPIVTNAPSYTGHVSVYTADVVPVGAAEAVPVETDDDVPLYPDTPTAYAVPAYPVYAVPVYANIDLASWTMDPATISFDIVCIQKQLNNLLLKQKFSELNDGIRLLFERLPMPSLTGGDLWASIDKSEITNLLTEFADLSERQLQAQFFLENPSERPIEFNINMHKVMAIQHRLITLKGPTEEMPFTEYPLPSDWIMGVTSNTNRLYSVCHSAASVKACLDLKDYFEGTRSKRLATALFSRTVGPYVGRGEIANSVFETRDIDTYQASGASENNMINTMLAVPITANKVNAKLGGIGTPVERFTEAYCDLNGTVLPKEFCALKQQALITRYCVTGYFPRLSSRYHAGIEQGKLVLKNFPGSTLNTKIVWPHVTGAHYEILLSDMDGQKRLRQGACSFTPSLDAPFDSLYQWISTSNLHEISLREEIEKHDFSPLSKAKVYEISSLFVQGSNWGGAAIPQRLIDYFLRNLNDLDDENYQNLFETLIYSKFGLHEALKQNPDFAKALKKIIQKGRHRAIQRGNIRSLVFFSRLSKSFSEHVNIQKHHLSLTFPSFKDDLNRMLLNSHSSPEDKSLIFREFIISMKEKSGSLTPADVCKILQARCYMTTHPLSTKNDDLDSKMSLAIYQLSDEIQAVLKGTDGRGILNTHARREGLITEDQDWDITSEFPVIRSITGPIGLNVLSGVSYSGFDSIGPLPNLVTGSTVYQTLFKEKNYSATNILGSGKQFAFSDQLGHEYYISIQADNSLVVFKCIAGLWYEYRSPETFKASQALHELPKSFLGTNHLIQGHQHWLNCDEKKLLIIRDGESEPAYVAHLALQAGELKLTKKIQRLPSEFLLSWDVTPMTPRIEAPEFSQVWTDSRGEPMMLEYPRFDLKFSIETDESGIKKAMCQPYNGFYIAEHQDISSMGRVGTYLLLKNDSGERRIILPKRTVLKQSHAAIDTTLTLDHAAAAEVGTTFTFAVDALGNISSPATEANLQLAYYFLQTKEYDKVKDLLLKCSAALSSYSQPELLLLDLIIRNQSSNGDANPKAIAVRLFATAILEKNRLTYAATEKPLYWKTHKSEELLKAVAADYTVYLQLSQHSGVFALNDEEELLMLGIFEGSQFNDRYNFLRRLVVTAIPIVEAIEVPAVFEAIEVPDGIIPNASYAEILKQPLLLRSVAKYIIEEKTFDESLLYIRASTSPELLLRPDEDLKHNFWPLFLVVRTQKILDAETGMIRPMTVPEKAAWKRKLRVMYNSANKETKVLVELLMAIHHSPEAFTSFQEMKAKVSTPFIIPMFIIAFKNSKITVPYNLSDQDLRSLGEAPQDTNPMGDEEVVNLYSNAKNVAPGKGCEYIISLFKNPSISDSLSQLLSTVVQFPDRFPPAEELTRLLQSGDLEALKRSLLHTCNTIYCEIEELYSETSSSGIDIQPLSLHAPIIPMEIPAEDLSHQLMISSAIPIERASDEQKLISNSLIEDATAAGTFLTAEESRSFLSNINSPSADTLIKDSFSMLRDDVEQFLALPQETQYDLIPEQIPNMRRHYRLSATINSRLMLQKEFELVNLANSGFGVKGDFSLLARQRSELDIDHLIHLFLKGNTDDFKKANPHLSDSEIQALYNGIAEYLLISTTQAKFRRIATLLEGLDSFKGSDKEKKLYTQGITRLILSKREYKAKIPSAADPEGTAMDTTQFSKFLVFEHYAGFMMHKDQVDNLNVLLAGDDASNIILQMIMGSGKSKVLLPLLALMMADGKTLPIIVVPESLYASTTKEMKNSSGTCFDQSTHVFSFDRSTPTTASSLRGLYERLQRVRRDKEYLLVTSKSLECLQLKFFELMQTSNKTTASPDIVEQLVQMKKICALLKNNGQAIIDEADLVLNCRKEVNYTLGDAQSVSSDHIETVSQLFELLIDPEMTALATFDFFSTDSVAPPLTAELYHSTVKVKLCDKFLEKLSTLPVSSSLAPFIPLYNAFSTEDKNEIRRYLCGEDAARSLIAGITSPDFQDFLALLKQELNQILPLSLQKNCDVNYGFSNKSESPLAMPFSANNVPSVGSQFANRYELINYTVQAYFKKGTTEKQRMQFLRDLQKDANTEMSLDESLSVKDTAAYKKYIAVFGTEEAADFITQTTAPLIKTSQALLAFIRYFALETITVHSEKMNCNGAMLVDMFAHSLGFSGTLKDGETLHDSLNVQPQKGTDGKTLAILHKNSLHAIHTLSNDSTDTVIDALFTDHADFSDYRAFIDAGAIFKGISNLEVAKALLLKSDRDKIQGIVFYDDAKQQMVLERDNETPIPLAASLLGVNDRLTYYDQDHITGADIKQHGNAKAFFSVGKDLTLRELLQGVWRMRGLADQQKIEFIIPKAVEARVRSLLNLDGASPLSVDHIIAFSQFNYATREGMDHFLALKQKIKNLVQMEVYKVIVDEETDNETSKALFTALESFFVSPVVTRPYLLYGHPEREVDSVRAAQEYIDVTLSAATLAKLDTIAAGKGADVLTAANKLRDTAHLSAKVTASQGEDQDTTQEVEQEVEQELELEVKVSSSYLIPKSTVTLLPWMEEHDLFDARVLSPLPISLDKPVVFGEPPPIYTLHERYAKNCDFRSETSRAFRNVHSSFSSSLQVTENFAPLIDKRDPRAVPFSSIQFPLQQVLLQQDIASGKFTLTLVSSTEAEQIANKLSADARHPPLDASKRTYKLCLFHPNSQGLQQGSDPIDLAEINADEALQSALVQAKFLNGDLKYTKKEKVLLKKWIETNDAVKLQTLFVDHIIAQHLRQSEYAGSFLDRLFKTITASALDPIPDPPHLDAMGDGTLLSSLLSTRTPEAIHSSKILLSRYNDIIEFTKLISFFRIALCDVNVPVICSDESDFIRMQDDFNRQLQLYDQFLNLCNELFPSFSAQSRIAKSLYLNLNKERIGCIREGIHVVMKSGNREIYRKLCEYCNPEHQDEFHALLDSLIEDKTLNNVLVGFIPTRGLLDTLLDNYQYLNDFNSNTEVLNVIYFYLKHKDPSPPELKFLESVNIARQKKKEAFEHSIESLISGVMPHHGSTASSLSCSAAYLLHNDRDKGPEIRSKILEEILSNESKYKAIYNTSPRNYPGGLVPIPWEEHLAALKTPDGEMGIESIEALAAKFKKELVIFKKVGNDIKIASVHGAQYHRINSSPFIFLQHKEGRFDACLE